MVPRCRRRVCRDSGVLGLLDILCAGVRRTLFLLYVVQHFARILKAQRKQKKVRKRANLLYFRGFFCARPSILITIYFFAASLS